MKLPHFHDDISGWFDFAPFYARLARELPPGGHMVEVGAWYGKSTAFLAVELINSRKPFALDVVDHWMGSKQEAELLGHAKKHDVHAAFLANMRQGGVLEYMNVRRRTSTGAARTYKDGTLDCVFLDASHDAGSVSQDVAAWWPKIKPGGLIAGHDWGDRGVVLGLLEHFDADELEIHGRVWARRQPRED
jgi:predicted O-methyltransferase YrrM